MKSETLGIIQILVASLLFGFIPILVRFGQSFGNYNLTFFRILVAVILLSFFFVLSRKYKLAPFKEEKTKLIFFGAIHGFIIVGYFIAVQYLSIASAVLLFYSSSIWMVIFSRIILKEQITKKTWIALIISFVGVLLVLSPQKLFIFESLIGSLLALLAAIGFGLVYVLSKTFKTYDKISLTFWQNLIALPFILPLVFIQLPSFNSTNILIVVLLGSLFTVVPFILVFKGFEKVPAQKGAIIILLDLIFSIIFALIIFKEVPSILAIIGGILIIVGSYLVSTPN